MQDGVLGTSRNLKRISISIHITTSVRLSLRGKTKTTVDVPLALVMAETWTQLHIEPLTPESIQILRIANMSKLRELPLSSRTKGSPLCAGEWVRRINLLHWKLSNTMAE